MSNSNSQVAHLWANASKATAKSSNGNLWFEGATLYSYRTPIGKRVYSEALGHDVYLVTSNRYSVTTSGKHMPALWRAIRYKGFTVPDVMAYDAKGHTANLAHLVEQYADMVASMKRRAKGWGSELERLQSTAQEANDYATAFGMVAPFMDAAADWQAVVAHRVDRAARNSTPEAIAKRARDAERKAAREAEKARLEALSYEEKREAWLNGAPIPFPRRATLSFCSADMPVYLRARGKVLETSLGAEVPLDHAIKVFQFVKACRASGRTWERNGQTIRVGHFQVDRVEANGDFVAGCHSIKWQEVERLAGKLGLLDLPVIPEAAQATS